MFPRASPQEALSRGLAQPPSHLPQALSITRQEIGQLLRLVTEEDTGKRSWILLRAPWSLPVDEPITQSNDNQVNVNALSATSHPHLPRIPLLNVDAMVVLPREGHEKGQQLRGGLQVSTLPLWGRALPDPRVLPAIRSTVL